MSEATPKGGAQATDRPALPKRFYKTAEAVGDQGAWGVALDGRPVRTPGRKPLSVASRALAEDIAAEWQAQETVVDPAQMPLTRLCNTAIDGVAPSMEAVVEDAARFAETDLLCYRAEDPEGLVARQNETWDPILAWARDNLGLSFNLAGGVMHVAQPPETLERVRQLLGDLDHVCLTGVHVMTSLTGSVVLALAVLHGRLGAEEAWAASLVDEDWQIGQWGEDAEAMRRRRAKWLEMQAAARIAGTTD
ncbi:ATP12 family chaperone protein [Microbaculum marinum]|uniref:ATP12 family protein n=1 Tax=Microbaculum marinum TaxID=1764581 RepID=A0AAW9RM95_9HYPH